MQNFKRLNTILGWAMFLAASIVYLITLEPTVSLWDCGEFITTAYKLEIGHPPGAPVYMLLGRIFALFTSDVTKVAALVNAFSALSSAAGVMFLFWCITHFGKKILAKNKEQFNKGNLFAIFGSGIVGALAFTFSDTLWFSAVEAEVYAASLMFTAVSFWAILKWEDAIGTRHANRWIILIALLTGIAIGIHLLTLLVIPPIVLVYYFRTYKPTYKGVFLVLILSFLILGTVMYVLTPLFTNGAAYFDLLFVNTFHLPFNSGVLFFVALVVALITYGLYYTHKKGKTVLNQVILSIAMILIGYLAYATIVIRSAADPPLDENNPESIFSLISYLNREQYGERPIFYGAYYNAPVKDVIKGRPKYVRSGDKYKVIDYKQEIEYDDRFTTIFPRMHSRRGDHADLYKKYIDHGIPIKVGDDIIYKPTFGDNLEFFFKYQLGYMYWRYFLWNFAGRQNDEQGHGGVLNGNWISGIKFLDELRLGPQDNLPDGIKNHPSRNAYYLLPFLLGIIGLVYHAQRHSKDFSVVLLLFFMTGIAIILYLNQPPVEPRERDYTFVGSFFAFSIWIGLGVMALWDTVRRKIPSLPVAILCTFLCLALVPGIMAKENWDDHDRSGRYTARAHAYNYLNSCAPNAILFTNGDNDTFPLWYLQEVEGIRTDVRVVNLMLLNMDWHILQAIRKAYESEPLPITLPKKKYIGDKNNMVPLIERINKKKSAQKKFIDLKKAINFVKNDTRATQVHTREGDYVDYIPTKYFSIPVDSAKIVNSGIVSKENADQIVSSINWKIKGRHLSKSDLIVLDILAHSNWERPIYFVSPHGNDLGLKDYMQLEGYAFRLVPIKKKSKSMMQTGRIDTDLLYDNYMNKFKWGNMNDPDIYLGHYDRRTLDVLRLRHKFNRLARELIKQNKQDSALNVLNRCVEIMPNHNYPFDYHMVDVINSYYRLGENEKASELINEFSSTALAHLDYYIKLRKEEPGAADREMSVNYHVVNEMAKMANQNGEKELYKEITEQLSDITMGMQRRRMPQQRPQKKKKLPIPNVTNPQQ
jgi:hypothetical protein